MAGAGGPEWGPTQQKTKSTTQAAASPGPSPRPAGPPVPRVGLEGLCKGGEFKEAELLQHRHREDGFVYLGTDSRPRRGQSGAGAATVAVLEALGRPLSSEQLSLLRVQPRGLVSLSPRGAWLALSKKGMPGQPVDGRRVGGQPSLLSVHTPSVRPVSWLDTPRLCVVTAWFCVRTGGSQKHSLPEHRPRLPLDSRPGRGGSGTWGPFSPSHRGPRRRHLGKAQCRQSHTCWGLLQLRILPPTVRSLSLSARARASFWIPSGFHSFREGEPQSCSILFVWVYPTA